MSAQLFPLDALGEWSRLYGPAGLLQYQFARAPRRGGDAAAWSCTCCARAACRCTWRCSSASGRVGGHRQGGPLSFPIEGLTLAIDLPAGAPGLYRALDEADELVAERGGRVYLAKDSRLRPRCWPRCTRELERFRELRGRVDPDGVLRSDMGRRLGLCG